ncbi:hypothetical protein PAHAL_2G245400 [Panicum hallii]|uniref:Uncharacterized protein n=1 Tax=Panicum hallii TaxID=206008 RepID=A0A2S3GZ53_9POAL|nr:hypothetical protein PAHAL_2G245400 [Panicum hallii]
MKLPGPILINGGGGAPTLQALPTPPPHLPHHRGATIELPGAAALPCLAAFFTPFPFLYSIPFLSGKELSSSTIPFQIRRGRRLRRAPRAPAHGEQRWGMDSAVSGTTAA